MRHLKTVLSEFCDADRLKFFKFVTGLTAIPVTRPGAAKPFQLLIDGKVNGHQLPAVGVGDILPGSIVRRTRPRRSLMKKLRWPSPKPKASTRNEPCSVR